MEDSDNSDVIRFDKFLTVMSDVLINRKFKPANENLLYKALQVLDSDSKGFYTKEDLIRLMTSEGEPFNAEEMNEMIQACMACADPDSQPDNPHILYKYYINELVVEGMKD
jgi:Ca2+-binding EF-hand superfamily protein